MHVSLPSVSVVLFGALASAVAFAGPNPAPHDEVIPSDDASHACPALEAKRDRAKSAAEATHFDNQLWAHGCFSCDDAWGKLEELIYKESSIKVFESIEQTRYETKASEFDAVLAWAAPTKESLEREESVFYGVLYPTDETSRAVFEGLAKHCPEQVELDVFEEPFNALSCRQSKAIVDGDCLSLEKEVLSLFEQSR